MTYIPDCRTDKCYNFDNLNDKNKDFVRGFDHCVETAAESFFNNLDVYYDDDSYFMHLMNEKLPQSVYERVVDDGSDDTDPIMTYGDLLKIHMQEWIESQRDELITALIDGQHEEDQDA